ncbi:MAG: DUF374 domain-containing protein [Aquificae bacterium]|nr:DUF374 domain-containing protein [Aquificota bacterium]
MRKLKYKLLLALTPLLGRLLRLLARTVRWENRPEVQKGVVYALWHGHALGMALYGKDRGIVVLVSRFRDGELAARLLKELGFETVRGSAEEGRPEKGGRSAAKKLVALLKSGRSVAVTVDGPKGPAYEVKRGVAFLAKAAGVPVVPVAVKFDRYWRLNTWDGTVVPKPFTRGRVLVGEPLEFEGSEEAFLLKLKERLTALSSS